MFLSESLKIFVFIKILLSTKLYLEVHQDLHHLFDEHLLEILVSSHEFDEDQGVPGLGSLKIRSIAEDAGSGLVTLFTAIFLE